VEAAAANFGRPNLRFLRSDARALPLADHSVDAVVSFETIEHFDCHDVFLSEIRRVLRPDGICIISTPDRDVYSPIGTGANPYHVRELNRSEFAALLAGTFRDVQVLQQRALIGSALLAEYSSVAPPLVFDRRGETHFEACAGLPRAPYLVAVASDGELPPLPPSLYIDRGDLDTEAVNAASLTVRLQQALEQLAHEQQSGALTVRTTVRAVQLAQQYRQEAEQERLRAQATEARLAALEQQHTLLRGSLRTFLRGYLPLLRSHLFGQRP
jgi:hypothetical protein